MYLKFGAVARELLGMQCQYVARYLKHPELATGVRWTRDLADYHFVQIHHSDVSVFVERVQEYRRKHGQI